MAKKTVEVDVRVIAIQTQMDNIIEDIRSIDLKKAELEALLDAKVQILKDSFSQKIDSLNSKRDYLITEIKPLFEQVPQSVTKTQRKVSLLSGDVVVKNATQKIDYDKGLLLDWARENCMSDYIDKKEVESFKWSEFKENLEVVGETGEIINKETGEVLEVDGLVVIDVAESIVIK